MISVAVIGAGNMAKIHSMNLKKIGVHLHTICAPASSAAFFQKKFKFDKVTTNYTTIKNVDFVLIATPSFTHYNINSYFLQNNISIFCEKPLVTNAEEARSLSMIASSSNANIYTNFQLRHRKEFICTKKY